MKETAGEMLDLFTSVDRSFVRIGEELQPVAPQAGSPAEEKRGSPYPCPSLRRFDFNRELPSSQRTPVENSASWASSSLLAHLGNIQLGVYS